MIFWCWWKTFWWWKREFWWWNNVISPPNFLPDALLGLLPGYGNACAGKPATKKRRVGTREVWLFVLRAHQSWQKDMHIGVRTWARKRQKKKWKICIRLEGNLPKMAEECTMGDLAGQETDDIVVWKLQQRLSTKKYLDYNNMPVEDWHKFPPTSP